MEDDRHSKTAIDTKGNNIREGKKNNSEKQKVSKEEIRDLI